MQPWPVESPPTRPVLNEPRTNPTAAQDGFYSQHQRGNSPPGDSFRDIPSCRDRGDGAVVPARTDNFQFDAAHRRLNLSDDKSIAMAGQRITDYESSAMISSISTPSSGFLVTKRTSGHMGGVQLTDLPNGAFFPTHEDLFCPT